MRLARRLGDRAVDLQRELLQVARHADGPGAVAEVALELAEDRRYRVAREGVATIGVEAVDRLQQSEARHLDQVVQRLAGALVTARQLARQRKEALDELGAGRQIAVALEALEQELLAQALAARCSSGVRNGSHPGPSDR